MNLIKTFSLVFGLINAATLHVYAQNSVSESCYCMELLPDTIEYTKVKPYEKLLHELNPSYLKLVFALSRNEDINRYQRYHYYLSLDKSLKFELAKRIYNLSSQKDSLQSQQRQELETFSDVLKGKQASLLNRIADCENNEQVKHYMLKRDLIDMLDKNYFSNYISVLNSTTDERRLEYTKLIRLEKDLLAQLDAHQKKVEGRLTLKPNPEDEKTLSLCKELIAEYTKQLEIHEYKQLNPMLKELLVQQSVPENQSKVIKEYILEERKKIILGQHNVQRVIVMNNEMYVIKNDSLIKVVNPKEANLGPDVFEDIKPISVDDCDGFFYTIQIGTYSGEKSFEDLNVKSNLLFKKLPDGKVRFSFGMYQDLLSAEKDKDLLRKIGVKDAFIIAYNNKERITMEEARMLSLSSRK